MAEHIGDHDEPVPESRVLEANATFGLDQGNLAPFAAYLRAGLPLTEELRSTILDTINAATAEWASDWPEYVLTMKKRRRGVGDVHSKVAVFERQLRIAMFVQEELPKYRDSVEAAVSAAMEKFSVSRSTVTAAIKVAKERRLQRTR